MIYKTNHLMMRLTGIGTHRGLSMKYAFIDTETTGLRANWHEMIELAIIIEINGQIIEQHHWRLKPQHLDRADEIALKINGYSHAKWRDAVEFASIANEVKDIISKCIIIGHNPMFDIEFLNEAFFVAGVPGIHSKSIDTRVLVHEHLHWLNSTSLDTVRKFFGWPTDKAHTALFDVQQTRNLYHKLCRCTVIHRLLWYCKYIMRHS